MIEQFKDLHLTVMELPVEVVENKPIYSGYLRELPFITGEGNSRVDLYRMLMERYQEYVETQIVEESTEEMTSSLLSVEQLLKYYDGEVFDGFDIDLEK